MSAKMILAGNWKMNGLSKQAVSLAASVSPSNHPGCEVVICPPFTHLSQVALARDPGVQLGAQDCSPHLNGAYTGDISAPMLADQECGYVILGHSERRAGYGEDGGLIQAKMKAAHSAGLITILCVGETQAERKDGKEQDVVKAQLQDSLYPECGPSNTVIAYEPVWAIGTGDTASSDDIRTMHALIRSFLTETLAQGDQMSILYGGSLKAENAAEILAVEHVNGGLIGGASLDAASFNQIIQLAEEAMDKT